MDPAEDRYEIMRWLIDETDVDELADYFTRPGAIELVSLMSEGGKRFDELDDELFVARGIIHERATEGLGFDLFEQDIRMVHGKSYKVWRLTDLGEAIAIRIQHQSLAEAHQEYRHYRKRFEEKLADFKTKVSDPDVVSEALNERLESLLQSAAYEPDWEGSR